MIWYEYMGGGDMGSWTKSIGSWTKSIKKIDTPAELILDWEKKHELSFRIEELQFPTIDLVPVTRMHRPTGCLMYLDYVYQEPTRPDDNIIN